ncbi:MAG TPA: LuxR C-terminal-related transcriptional regulator [Steroidobacter sp.]|uniref:LuxR C-terminal-related transcriptional regulator n=1 Tax=Steroidobacter sp. TaxID=1978227 RepID=UPI002EDB3481
MTDKSLVVHFAPPATNRPAGAPYRFVPNVGFETPVERSDLHAMFVAAPPRSVTLLQAPAGYGKTYALAQWANAARAAGSTVAWINLTKADRGKRAFVAALTDSLASAQVMPHGAERPVSHLHEDALDALDGLLTTAARHPAELLLILDDFHNVDTPEVAAVLDTLFVRLPTNIKVAISSRLAIGLASSRLLLQGRLQRIERAALAFTKKEAQALFASAFTPTQLKEAYAICEGWPAMLRFAQLCGEDWRRLGTSLEHVPAFASLVKDFVLTELLADLDAPLVEFLIETSVTDVLRPDFADAVRQRKDSRAMLDDLAARSTFLQCIEIANGSWAVPPLVRRVLYRLLQSRRDLDASALHSRAALWLVKHASLREAVVAFIAAGTPEAAARAIEDAGGLNFGISHGDNALRSVLDLLPEDHLRASPRLRLARIFVDFKQGLQSEAQQMFDELSRVTEGFTTERGGPASVALQADALLVRCLMQFYLGGTLSAERLKALGEELTLISGVQPRRSTMIYIFLGLYQHMRGDLDLAHDTLLQAERSNAQEYSAWEALWLKQHFATVALARGNLAEARRIFSAGQRQWREEFQQEPTFFSLTKVLLAEIDYELDDLNEARSKIDEAMYTVEHVEAWFEMLASLYETVALTTYTLNGAASIEPMLARLESIPRSNKLLHNFLPALRMRLALLNEDDERAAEICSRHDFAARWNDPGSPEEFAWREWDLIGVSLAELALNECRLTDAAAILQRLESDASRRGRKRTWVRALVLKSALAHSNNQHDAAHAALIAAFEIGSANEYRRTFLDMRRYLQRPLDGLLASRTVPIEKHLQSFAAKLQALLSKRMGTSKPAAPALLSAREREVLIEISLGHSNKVIARKLGLSEPTVKFHVQNIFRKLDVRKRTTVVAEAHKRGVLP